MERLKNAPIHQQVIETVCTYYGLTKEELFSKNRQELYATARHTCFFLLHDSCSLGASAIARLFECRKSTVQYGIEKLYRQQNSYAGINRRIKNIQNSLKDNE